MLVRHMLLHRMALASVRLFCKNLGNLQVSQNMVSSSEPSVNQTLDFRSIKHFRIA